MRIFAILHEPAQYTTDRNRAVYEPLGVRYAYMHGQSEAKSDEGKIGKALSELSWWQLAKWTCRLLRDNDIIIMNGYNNMVFIMLFMLNTFYGRVIGIDSDTPLSVPQNTLKRMLKSAYLHVIFSNRHIYGLAGGSQSHKELFRHYGMRENHIFLMPMMVNNEKFYNHSDAVKSHPFTFLYVGRIVECKNLGVLLQAFSKTFENNSDVQLRLVGGGELLDSYKRQYSGFANIIFAGKKFGEDLIKEYHKANAFVLPSSYEPWGLVVNEALCAGLPVIVSDRVGAAHDLVEDKGTGFVFRYDDVADLANRMQEIVTDEKLYEQCSQNAKRLMRDKWNYDFYTNSLNSFIEYVSKR